MEFGLIGLVLIIILVISDRINDARQDKQLEEELTQNWASAKERKCNDEKYEKIMFFYQQKNGNGEFVDDITWNDLEMNTMYERLNSTRSSIGEEYLYYLLRKMDFDLKSLTNKDRLITFFQENEKDRLKVQKILSAMGIKEKISIYEFLKGINEAKQKKCWIHYFQAAALVLGIILIILGDRIGIGLTFGMIFVNVVTYFVEKAKITPHYRFFAYVSQMSLAAVKISKLDAIELKEFSDLCKSQEKIWSPIRNAMFLIGGNKTSGNVVDMIFDYVRMLFHIDIMAFYRLLRIVISHGKELEELYDCFGQLDSLVAVASFRDSMALWSRPEFMEGDEKILECENIAHPMVLEPVTNTIFTNKSVLLTGSNASGKSTFIKAIAINGILAQSIFTSISTKYRASFFRICSSMALKDNLLNRESYYIVEIKSLKRILDRTFEENKIPVLCFVDEVLRGTNTLERIAASSKILSDLAKNNCICFAATHDIELTQILKNYYDNYHFQERVEADDVIFDYKLYREAATSRNAIKLLHVMGYPKEIVDGANDQVSEFFEKGTWKEII